MKKLILIIGFIMFFGNSYPQINLTWYSNQNNLETLPGNPSGKSIDIDSLGNIYTVAYLKGDSVHTILKTTKYTGSGATDWSNSKYIRTSFTGDYYSCFIRVLNNGRIAIAFNFLDSSNFNNIGIIVYNSSGGIIADTKYRGHLSDDNFVNAVTVDNAGNFLLTGYSVTGYNMCIVLKYKNTGDLIWNQTVYAGSTGKDIITDNSGNIYVSGTYDSGTSLKTYMLTTKFDSTGVRKWLKVKGFYNQYISSGDEATSITLDDSLNVIIGGSAFKLSRFLYLAKFKNNGDTCWSKIYTNLTYSSCVTTDSRCNIYIAGYNENPNVGILKYSPGGTRINTFTSSTEILYILKFFKGKYLYTAGYKARGTAEQTDFYFAIMDTNLAILNNHTFFADTSKSDNFSSMVFDKNGNVYLSGKCMYDSLYTQTYKFTTVKLLQNTGINLISSKVVNEFKLSQNYPNPFNPTTKIKFTVPSFTIGGKGSETRRGERFVTLKVYDILGKEIATLVNEKLGAGEYETTFDARNGGSSRLTSGIYFYRFVCGDFSDTKRMILIK